MNTFRKKKMLIRILHYLIMHGAIKTAMKGKERLESQLKMY